MRPHTEHTAGVGVVVSITYVLSMLALIRIRSVRMNRAFKRRPDLPGSARGGATRGGALNAAFPATPSRGNTGTSIPLRSIT